jgi:alkylhydroperoxidase/carboxymuconolactone decarboxylase family protein YurZ
MDQPQKRPAEVLAEANPAAAEAFAQLRHAVEAGPLDQQTVELIVIGSLASVGQLGSLAVHVKRAAGLGVTIEQINQAIVSTLAASTLFNDVVAALRSAQTAYASTRATPAG